LGCSNSHYPTVPGGAKQSAQQSIATSGISMADIAATSHAGLAHMPLSNNPTTALVPHPPHHAALTATLNSQYNSNNNNSNGYDYNGIASPPYRAPSLPPLAIKPPLGFGSGMSGTLPPLKYSTHTICHMIISHSMLMFTMMICGEIGSLTPRGHQSNATASYASGSQTARRAINGRAGQQQAVVRYANQMSDDNPFTPPAYSEPHGGQPSTYHGMGSGAVTQRSGVHYYPAVPFDRDLQKRIDGPLVRHMEYITAGGAPMDARATRAFIAQYSNEEEAPPTATLAATLPLLGNWSAQRAIGDDYPLYGYQSKYQY
jgi:hypothetical protein